MAGLLASLFGGGGGRSLDEAAWDDVTGFPVFDGLTGEERDRLRQLARELLAHKAFSGAAGVEVDDAMATAIAAFAALPVLNLGTGWYDDWREIVVYPAEFIHEGEQVDEHGIVHRIRHVRSGEAMQGGPVVLSWDDVMASGGGAGYNVVIHEFAHKLDMRGGGVNGRPPLHSAMSPEAWATAWQAAYEDIVGNDESGQDTEIDPYAGESPAECFAVLTEYFFEAPDVLYAHYPAVYEQLGLFFRQDPLERMTRHDPSAP